jgi:phosphopantetheinyl transferase (holo-ACP synthase)
MGEPWVPPCCGRPKPGVRLSGRTRAWAERTRAGAIDLSMTHSRELAAAICLVSDV